MHLINESGSLNSANIRVENTAILSEFLQREVNIDFFLPQYSYDPSQLNLLLINDGQNMEELGLANILEQLYSGKIIRPILCVAIHASADRKMEYGIAGRPDYLGRGAKAGLYTSFILHELLPFIYKKYGHFRFKEKAFAGFSLGGLMAMDIVWNHSDEFSKTGVFSGSFWWRSVNQTETEYEDDKHRIMQQLVRNGKFAPGLKFFFQCGNKDETRDRNKNGIIDSIDDTMDLVRELEKKGYSRNNDIYYLELPDGKHDIATWRKAMPQFLKWGWGK